MHEEASLIDIPLIADPDADQEMSAAEVEAITDADLRGSRLLLVRKSIANIETGEGAAAFVQFTCTFQPADGARFSSAQLTLRFRAPEGVRIIDLAPRIVDDPHPVELTLSRKGQLSLKTVVEPGAEISASKTYARYHCLVQGSGAGTNLARWDFRENPDRRDGVGRESVLTLTLTATGDITGEVIAGARLVRKGFAGAMDAVRDLILGPRSTDRVHPISFRVPTS